jgi:hypothetical protein
MTQRKPPRRPFDHLQPSDLRAAAQLATQATRGVTRITEGVHQAVWSVMGVPGGQPEQTRGITGFVYRTVHGVTELVGKGLEAAFTRLEPLLESLVDAPEQTPEREAVLAALNGVMGDRLLESNNPLATPMGLRFRGRVLTPHAMPAAQQVNGKVLVLVHGLCMNDLQWAMTAADAHAGVGSGTAVNHGDALAQELGYTPVYLRYNTGLHTSVNGHELARRLEELLDHWPVPVQELTLLVHSMGGLVARSAVHSAQQGALMWPRLLKNIVFLGTPHHGAPLERAGNVLDVILAGTPFSKPFARLGQLRSPGITDLRFGHVQDADWQGHDRFRRGPDRRTPLPLPEGVACFTVAATRAARRSLLSERVIGDGLVPLASALGQHPEPQHRLAFPKAHQWIGYRMDHWDLLRRPEVARQIVAWLQPRI